MLNKNLNNDSLTELLASVEDDNNQFAELGRRIGPDNLNAVLEVFGSQKPHVPTPDSFWARLLREERNAKIRQEFNGRNYAELAEKYSGHRGLGTLSERHVREIVHGHTKTYKRPPESMKPIKAAPEVYNEIAQLAEKHHVPMHQILLHAWLHLMAKDGAGLLRELRERYGEQQGIDLDKAA